VAQTGVTVTKAVWSAIRKGLVGEDTEWSIEMLLRPRGDVAEAAAAVTAVLRDLQAAWERELEPILYMPGVLAAAGYTDLDEWGAAPHAPS
jgi:hypothetical protein